MTEIAQSPFRKIIETVNTVDPEGKGVLVGSAARRLYFTNYEWPVKEVGDVDLLMGNVDMGATVTSLRRDPRVKEIDNRFADSMVKMADRRKRTGVVRLSTGDDLYDVDLLTGFDNNIFSITPEDARRDAVDIEGVKVTPLETLLRWQIGVGRVIPSETEQAITLTEHAISNGLVGDVAAKALMESIRELKRYQVNVYGGVGLAGKYDVGHLHYRSDFNRPPTSQNYFYTGGMDKYQIR